LLNKQKKNLTSFLRTSVREHAGKCKGRCEGRKIQANERAGKMQGRDARAEKITHRCMKICCFNYGVNKVMLDTKKMDHAVKKQRDSINAVGSINYN
jgi:hypothetical protein